MPEMMVRHRAQVSRASVSDSGSERSLLRMEAISKAYPGVVANDDVSFDLATLRVRHGNLRSSRWNFA